MKKITWNSEKNKKLIKERGISFEIVVYFIENGQILDDFDHPNKKKYGNQNIFVVNINNYAYLVPYIETNEEIFLKTIIPSRKATRKYLRGKNE